MKAFVNYDSVIVTKPLFVAVYSKLVENQSKAEFWVRVIMSQGS
jgi:hypothetical protein